LELAINAPADTERPRYPLYEARANAVEVTVERHHRLSRLLAPNDLMNVETHRSMESAAALSTPARRFGTARRATLLLCGTLSLGLGLLGVFVPLLPTTCFLLLAAWCYARSSQRLYDRLLNARLIGPYLRQYRESRVIPPSVKIAALVMMWITIGYAVLTYPNLAVRLTLLVIAIGVTWHLLALPAQRKSSIADSRRLERR
jgi:uncharacterized membrane protein YbaN (DUF454 family)